MPVPRVKARWDVEELIMLAKEEIRLTDLGIKNINSPLHAFMPHRSLESIKGARRKANRKYQKILEELRCDSTVNLREGRISASISIGESIVNENLEGQNELNNNSGTIQPLWWESIIEDIRNFEYCISIDADEYCTRLSD